MYLYSNEICRKKKKTLKLVNLTQKLPQRMCLQLKPWLSLSPSGNIEVQAAPEQQDQIRLSGMYKVNPYKRGLCPISNGTLSRFVCAKIIKISMLFELKFVYCFSRNMAFKKIDEIDKMYIIFMTVKQGYLYHLL